MKERIAAEFPAFPYKPYPIQIDFMRALYQSIDKGGVSMLESPTGTGKTISIICSALQWVLDQRQRSESETKDESDGSKENGASVTADDEPDWIRNFVVSKDIQTSNGEGRKKSTFGVNKLERMKKKENSKVSFSFGEECCSTRNECKRTEEKDGAIELDEDEFLLEEYESEDEAELGNGKTKRKSGLPLYSSTDEEDDYDGTDKDDEKKLKVYFCSRTHSQLSQFIKELRKTEFCNYINVVCLGSRKTLCINEDIIKLGSPTVINERCLEIQQNKKKEVSKIMVQNLLKTLDTSVQLLHSANENVGAQGRTRRTKASSGCPMLRKQNLQVEFKSLISKHEAFDIEDLVRLGTTMGTCPYYGTRKMAPLADLVVLPYQSLLMKSSRESLGLNLKNNIIIIDEAHNLADSLIKMYDAKITLPQLETLQCHIQMYLARFYTLLGPGSRRHIQTLIVLIRAFLQVINEGVESRKKNQEDTVTVSKQPFDSSMTINDFLFTLNIDNINMFKLLSFMKESNIIHKVTGYGDKLTSLQIKNLSKENRGTCEDASALSGFRALVDILSSLKNSDGDGRMIISRKRPAEVGLEGGYLKYVMLTGEKIFAEIIDEARAVVLAGGTLQPIEETRDRLFPFIPSEQFHFFSCGHIIPPENILPIAVSSGPTGRSFDFSYSSRSSSTMIEELGLFLCNLATAVPEGIIVFFSSFEYEGQVFNSWKASGILERIMKRKYVFREPKGNTDVETVLKGYKETINKLSNGSKENAASQNGAILLAVVGGKISEGINFSDGMGRCIVMVGLPYPSPSDIELVERIKHIEGLACSTSSRSAGLSVTNEYYYNGDVQAGFSILRSCRHRGKEYYENLCMKAVNQSIGRAIRHINDYAAILLVDARYTFDSRSNSVSHPTSKLPNWIKQRLTSATNYGEVHKFLHHFFKFKGRG